MPQIRECPNCHSLLNDDGTCTNCGYGRPSVAITPTATTSSTIDVMMSVAPITPPPDASKFHFEIRAKLFEIENINAQMNSVFCDLHDAHFSDHTYDWERFKQLTMGFFDENQEDYRVHDQFFNNFTIIWKDYLNRKLFDKAEELWKFALDLAYEWQDGDPNRRIHKGTPYYFWSVTCFMNQKLDEAFLLMHQALDEDKDTHGTETPATPAYAFVILDPTQRNQFFREKVVEISNFVETLLEYYRLTRGGRLIFSQFKSRFLEQTNIQETVFYFVYGVFRLKQFLDTYQKMKSNVFSSLLEANALFDLCLVVDTFIKSKYCNSGEAAQATFGHHLRFLSSNREHRLRPPLSFSRTKIGQLNQAFKSNFANTLEDLLGSNFRFQDGSSFPRRIEEDFAIEYGIRNFGGHRLENQPAIYENFEELSKRILNTLFFLVENCV